MRHAKDPTPIICHGTWEGQIATQPKGDGGFGYDPVFYVPNLNRHAAELDKDEKRKYSHRAQALAKLQEQLRKL
jgi:XTP/dITP diphosphohydrolase